MSDRGREPGTSVKLPRAQRWQPGDTRHQLRGHFWGGHRSYSYYHQDTQDKSG